MSNIQGASPSLRILVLSRSSLYQGGVVNFVQLLLQNLSENISADQFIISLEPKQRGRLARAQKVLTDAIGIFCRVRQGQIDVVHLNPSLDTTALMRDAVFLWTIKTFYRRCAVLIFIHGWNNKFLLRLNRNQLIRWLFIKTLKRANCIVVLGNIFKQQLVSLGIDDSKLRVMTTMFSSQNWQGATRIHHSFKRLVFMARLIKEKGIYELLEAFRLLHEEIPDLDLLILGDGPEGHNIKKYITEYNLEGSVKCLGYVKGNEKTEALMSSDIFVLPTYHGEGCPIALLEAMAAGLAVVTTAVGGIPDIVIEGRNGVLLKSTSPEEIKNTIMHLLLNDDIQRYKEINRQEAWQKYEASKVSKQVERLYFKITKT